MKSIQVLLFSLSLMATSVAEESLPESLNVLLQQRKEAVARLDKRLNEELEKVKWGLMKEGDLDGANSVEALISDPTKQPAVNENDPLIGTTWNFLGKNKQKINEFRFLRGGKVKCESSYNNATWTRLDDQNILFSYGTDSSFIVFRGADAKSRQMEGWHYGGRSRSIQRVK